MNKYYSYPNIEYWKTENWADKMAPLHRLIEYIMETNKILPSDYQPSYDDSGDLKKHPLYREKTHGIDDPAVVKDLNDAGLYYLCTGQGGRAPIGERCWFAICPQSAVDNWTKLPCLIDFDREDERDPRWTMRAVKRYQKEIDLLKKNMDFVLIVLIDEDIDYDNIFFNILQEISTLFPCDLDHFYMNVSRVLNQGMQLKEVPGFKWVDLDGNEEDPDEKIEKFSELEIPVLNLKGHWGNGDSLARSLIMIHAMNEGKFNREWLVHSEVGKRMAQDLLIDYNYKFVEDPGLIKEMEERGLVYQVRYTQLGDRYIVAAPRQQVEENTMLPVVLVLQEVYPGNEHLAVTANTYAGEWLEIAAQGECIVIFFVLEDIVSNDRGVDIVKKTAEEFPIDLTRVYVTGHSHDGYFTYAFANRNPDFVTAIATLGMSECPFGMNEKADYTKPHNIRNYDIPEVNITGLWESRFPANEEEKLNVWLPKWKFTLDNFNIPPKSDEEILGAFESKDYVQRTTCMPGDRFSVLWADGIEHYFVDFINKEGKIHFRVIRQQNMPHSINPMMCSLSWDFLRRFRRDPDTKEIIELF